MSYSQLADNVLIEMLSNDDVQAFQAVYHRYWQGLFQVCSRKLKSDDLAGEVVQDIFVDLWERRHALAITYLDRYLFSALKYKVIDQIRRQIVRKEVSDEVVEELLFYIDERAESNLALAELEHAIDKALGHMPAKTRDIFKMSRMEHHSVREISSILQIPERTVEYHLTQSIRLMRRHLKDYAAYLLVALVGFFS